MTEQQIKNLIERIDCLDAKSEALFGQMNVNQMVCHCTDFFRMAKGEKKALEYNILSSSEIINIAKSGKTAPTAKGFGQIEGDGTPPTNLKKDKILLKEYLLAFSELSDQFNFALHPYFGKMNREKWVKLAIYHLDHHLKQFGV